MAGLVETISGHNKPTPVSEKDNEFTFNIFNVSYVCVLAMYFNISDLICPHTSLVKHLGKENYPIT